MMISEFSEKMPALPAPALGLLPAVHDATVTAYTTGDLPVAADNIDEVYVNNSSAEITLPASGAWPAQRVAVGGNFASDGVLLYPVTGYAGTSSFYPRAFERVVATLAFTAESLPLRERWMLDRAVETRLFSNTTDATWTLFFEIGMRTVDTSPGTPGPNIASYTWRTPLIAQQFFLTDVLQTAHLGVSLYRDITGETEFWTGIVTRYGKGLAATEGQLPTGNDFVLRIRWGQFDTLNSPKGARGYAAYIVKERG